MSSKNNVNATYQNLKDQLLKAIIKYTHEQLCSNSNIEGIPSHCTYSFLQLNSVLLI